MSQQMLGKHSTATGPTPPPPRSRVYTPPSIPVEGWTISGPGDSDMEGEEDEEESFSDVSPGRILILAATVRRLKRLLESERSSREIDYVRRSQHLHEEISLLQMERESLTEQVKFLTSMRSFPPRSSISGRGSRTDGSVSGIGGSGSGTLLNSSGGQSGADKYFFTSSSRRMRVRLASTSEATTPMTEEEEGEEEEEEDVEDEDVNYEMELPLPEGSDDSEGRSDDSCGRSDVGMRMAKLIRGPGEGKSVTIANRSPPIPEPTGLAPNMSSFPRPDRSMTSSIQSTSSSICTPQRRLNSSALGLHHDHPALRSLASEYEWDMTGSAHDSLGQTPQAVTLPSPKVPEGFWDSIDGIGQDIYEEDEAEAEEERHRHAELETRLTETSTRLWDMAERLGVERPTALEIREEGRGRSMEEMSLLVEQLSQQVVDLMERMEGRPDSPRVREWGRRVLPERMSERIRRFITIPLWLPLGRATTSLIGMAKSMACAFLWLACLAYTVGVMIVWGGGGSGGGGQSRAPRTLAARVGARPRATAPPHEDIEAGESRLP